MSRFTSSWAMSSKPSLKTNPAKMAKVKAIKARIQQNDSMLPTDVLIEIEDRFGVPLEELRYGMEQDIEDVLTNCGVK